MPSMSQSKEAMAKMTSKVGVQYSLVNQKSEVICVQYGSFCS